MRSADIFVLVIGGRYGSAADAAASTQGGPYDSITKSEYDSAVRQDIPIYILIERAVYAEYQTYLLNKDNAQIKYAHVDSPNVFELIEHILSKHCNNPVYPFDRFADIQRWLREQWAGYFRELLNRKSSQAQN